MEEYLAHTQDKRHHTSTNNNSSNNNVCREMEHRARVVSYGNVNVCSHQKQSPHLSQNIELSILIDSFPCAAVSLDLSYELVSFCVWKDHCCIASQAYKTVTRLESCTKSLFWRHGTRTYYPAPLFFLFCWQPKNNIKQNDSDVTTNIINSWSYIHHPSIHPFT